MNMKKELSFKEAAIEILKKADKAMSPEEIIKEALEHNLIDPEGKTPVASMGALIYTDIKKNPNSNFIKVSKGKFKLRSSLFDDDNNTEELIENHNRKTIETLQKKLSTIDPFLFEQMIGDLLIKIGYENVQVTKRSADGGIDVIANLRAHGLTDVNTIVQVKRYKNNVQDKVVRELRGSAEVGQRGLIITTSNFTEPAIKEAKASNKMPISLVNGTKLLELLEQYEIGIKKELREITSIDSQYFSSLEIKDDNIFSTEKNMSIWPLPGGIFNYYNALIEIVIEINKLRDKSQIIKWFKEHFENVESDKTISGYLQVLRSIGLTYNENSNILLTEVGKLFVQNPSKEIIFNHIQERVFGFNEILDYLNESNEPKSETDVRDFLNNTFEIDWKSTAQTSYRLLWLCNLDKISRDDDCKYIINKIND